MNPDDVASEICRKLGYDFVGLVGSGAFKHTFHVQDKGQSLALKLFQPHGVSERSAREIEAMEKCDHPGIAKFIGLSSITVEDCGFIYLLEEYLAGGSLTSRIGRISPRETALLARNLADAIEHIGSQRLVHRDLKPDNIMFRDASLSRPVIVDFGLVRDLTAMSLTASNFMSGPGTAAFAAPEQLNNEKEMITARTDQFGLGVTLAVVLFQAHPYARPGDSSLTDAIQRVVGWERPALEFVQACQTSRLKPLIRMVQPYPVERYRTGRDLVDAWQAEVNR